ncbi:class I SAM-dependent methyltransferase, partial [Escherichia coli]|nr:class I SAM-dependent methyltransferase [Escherichia coli]
MAKRREPFVSLLDVGCGSGELLLETARFGKRHGIRTRLFGIDLNPISAQIAHEKLAGIDSAAIVRADAFRLP